jgi:ABC-2 type transport system ATP-binding protein
MADLRHLTRTSIQAELTRPVAGLGDLSGVHDLRSHNGRVSFDVDTAALDSVLRQLTEAGVRSLVSRPPTLEELFLRHYSADGVTETPAAVKG